MKKHIVITSAIVLTIGTLGYFYMKKPKGTIIINSDGSGTAKLGNKIANFEKDTGVVLKTWNGWELSAGASSMTLRHFGKTYEQGDITQYMGGSSNVEIIHNK